MFPEWFDQGGFIMYALLACSLAAVTITVERLIYWTRRRRDRDPERVDRACQLLARGAATEAHELIGDSRDGIARVMTFGLTHQDGSLEAALQMAAAVEIRGMRKFLRVLDTIVTVAPLLGILGTVLGIITSFDVIGGGHIDNPVEVTGGIAQALVTTAAGLVVAIVALIPYNYFTGRAEDAIGEMEGHLTTFVIMLGKGQRGGGSP